MYTYPYLSDHGGVAQEILRRVEREGTQEDDAGQIDAKRRFFDPRVLTILALWLISFNLFNQMSQEIIFDTQTSQFLGRKYDVTIRVTNYGTQRLFTRSSSDTYHCSVSSRAAGTTKWVNVVDTSYNYYRHNSDKPPVGKADFLTEDTGYFYVGRIFAVTRDGGRNWSLWDADKALPDFEWWNYGFFSDVEIEQDGTGRIRLDDLVFRTSDFGKTWLPEEQPAGKR